MTDEMYESFMRTSDGLGAFFEHDGEGGWFYLWDESREPGWNKIVGGVRVCGKNPPFSQDVILITFDRTGRYIGLLVKRRVWAAFEVATRAIFGGNYYVGHLPEIPDDLARLFIME